MASTAITRFKLIFHAPPSAVQACKTAIFNAGAGRYPGPGNYTECCWSTMGTGQFRPGDAATPHIGAVGALEEIPEVQVETLCVGEEVTKQAVAALKAEVSLFFFLSIQGAGALTAVSSAHPYEEPAYHVIKLEDF